MTPITITLPWPRRMNSPNTRGHWGSKASAAAKAKKDGANAARAVIGPKAGQWWTKHAGPVRVTVAFTPPVKRPDTDNAVAWVKHELDGIAFAIGIDDSRWQWSAPVVTAPRRPGCVVVTIEPVEAP